MLAEHRRVTQAGRFDVPTLFFPDGQCLFGPVLIDPPTGGRPSGPGTQSWPGPRFPHLYEIQRPKSRSDAEQIAAAFRPYLQARDWVSILHVRARFYPADRMAQDIVRGIDRNAALVVAPASARLAWNIWRYTPLVANAGPRSSSSGVALPAR